MAFLTSLVSAVAAFGFACILMTPGQGSAQTPSAPTKMKVNTAGGTILSTETLNMKIPEYLLDPSYDDDLSSAISHLREMSLLLSAPEAVKDCMEELNRLHQLKREFSLTPDVMFDKLKSKIPDVTKADMQKWTKERALSWIPIDGEVRYFRREPGILLRINKGAKARTEEFETGDPGATVNGGFTFNGHISAALDAARDQKTSLVLPVKFQVTHKATLKPGKARPGETVRCWLPYPREDVAQQSDIKLVSMSPKGKISSDADSPQRTVYFEKKAGGDGGGSFTLKYEYTFSAFVPDLSKARPQLSDAEKQEFAPYLQERSPHVILNDEVRTLSRELVGDETTVVGKAFAIWSWLDENVPWCPEMEYVVMPNIVSKVLAEHRGDCGTQALTFIALARAAGVPARWQSGWVTKPGKWNMHDWAEFYAPGVGWVPVDPSVGRQKSDDPAVRDFLFGHMESYRMIANSDHNAPFSPPKVSFRGDPVDNQRGEMELKFNNIHDELELDKSYLGYDDWSYDVTVKSE